MESREEDVGTKVRLAGAWATLIALYIYADFLSLYRPGQLEEISRGALAPFDVSPSDLAYLISDRDRARTHDRAVADSA